MIGVWVFAVSHAGVTSSTTDVSIELELLDSVLDEGEAMVFEVRILNGGGRTVQVAPPLDGSFEGMRDPRWALEFLDPEGQVVPDALGYRPEGRCKMTNALTSDDVNRVDPGATWSLASSEIVWSPAHEVLPSARPGAWQVRVRYTVEDAAPLTPMSLVSEPVPVRITGGDAALWTCRRDQLAARNDPVTQGRALLAPRDDGGFWMVSDTRTGSLNQDSSRQLRYRPLTADLSAAGPLLSALAADLPGFVAIASGSDFPVIVSTPRQDDGRRSVEVWRSPTGPDRIGNTDSYGVAVAPSGPRTAVAWGDPDEGLRIQRLDRNTSKPLAPPGDDQAGFPTLVAAGDGFLAVWEASSGQGLAQWLDGELNGVGERMSFGFDGQTIASARALPGRSLEIVYADASYQTDDPDDQMGLYRMRVPDGAPVALSPVDRERARFGAGAWLQDGAFLRVFEDDGAIRAGPEAAPTFVLSTAGQSPAIQAVGDRFVVTWSDWRDDRSVACTELSECSHEGYGALIAADGTLLHGPTRLTTQATPHPVAPYDDWERFCR